MGFLFKKLEYLLWGVAALFSCYAHSTAPIVCNQMYALCTSARCIPLPENSNKAICECVTKQGPSVGFKSCEQRKPYNTKYQTLSLVSTFSFAQFAVKQSMNCPKGMPWTDCVDMPCTVDPQNKKRALCQCKINTTQAFVTFGGSCNTGTCATSFWSGATLDTAEILRKTLLQSVPFVKATRCSTPISTKDIR